MTDINSAAGGTVCQILLNDNYNQREIGSHEFHSVLADGKLWTNHDPAGTAQGNTLRQGTDVLMFGGGSGQWRTINPKPDAFAVIRCRGNSLVGWNNNRTLENPNRAGNVWLPQTTEQNKMHVFDGTPITDIAGNPFPNVVNHIDYSRGLGINYLSDININPALLIMGKMNKVYCSYPAGWSSPVDQPREDEVMLSMNGLPIKRYSTPVPFSMTLPLRFIYEPEQYSAMWRRMKNECFAIRFKPNGRVVYGWMVGDPNWTWVAPKLYHADINLKVYWDYEI